MPTTPSVSPKKGSTPATRHERPLLAWLRSPIRWRRYQPSCAAIPGIQTLPAEATAEASTTRGRKERREALSNAKLISRLPDQVLRLQLGAEGAAARPSILADSHRVARASCVSQLLCCSHVYLGEMGLAQTPLSGRANFPRESSPSRGK